MNITTVKRFLASFILCILAVSVVSAAEGPAPAIAPASLQNIQQKMMNDDGIMTLITALQDDPEVRALLADPKVVEAVLAGNFGVLLDDPRIQKLMNAPQVREIEQRLQAKGSGGAK